MQRCGLTIIYEGLHHLQHKNFADKMLSMFDHWIVVEGHALPFGSTKRCNRLQVPSQSKDGTVEFMQALSDKHDNIHFFTKGNSYFSGKDHMVNTGIAILKTITKKCYLWEVDVDEHWKIEDLEKAEAKADKSTAIGFSFPFNHYLADDLIAKGEWGSGYLNRLWKWSGQSFRSHEPALLEGQRYCEAIEDVRFEHYSYCFDKDVKFKSEYYAGHQHIYKNIDKVRNADSYPVHISQLFGDTFIGRTNSYIYKITKSWDVQPVEAVA